jgi:hypothetical protein
MGKISINDRRNGRIESQRVGGLGLVAIMGLALVATGCGKSKSATVQMSGSSPVEDTNPPPVTNQMPVYQQPASANPATAAVQPAAGPDLRELDRGLIRWIVSNHRRPGSFEEFAATANITIPPPPTGKKYAFDHTMHIQLVDR